MRRLGYRISPRAARLLIAAALPVILWAASAEARSIKVKTDDGTRRIGAYRSHDVDYVSLGELLHAMGAQVSHERRTDALRADLDGHQWLFWGNSSMVGRDDDVFVLGEPVINAGDVLAAPLAHIIALLGRHTTRRLTWDPGERTLLIEGGRFNVTGFRIQMRENGILVEFGLTEPLPYEAGRSEGNWVNLTIHGAHLDAPEFRLRGRHKAVREIRAYQFEESAQISIRFRQGFERYIATLYDDPQRLALLIQDESAHTRAAARAATPPQTRPIGRPIKLIVLDPGHGGGDTGARGRRRDWTEKDAVLSIARYTAALFARDDDCRVILTREDDRYLSPAERGHIANDAGADLFISLHTGMSSDPEDAGSQTFFRAAANSQAGRDAALRENTLDTPSEFLAATAATESLDWSQAANHYQALSTEFAQIIQSNFENELKIPSRGVDQAEFDVLAGLEMPAILIQCAHISNVREEKLLRRESFQKRVAKALYRGIMEFKQCHDPSD